MSKKVVVISSSPRKGQNSDTLCDEFVRGAIDAGNDAVKYFLEDIEFASCKACYACKTPEMKCIQDDGIAPILEDMLSKADPDYKQKPDIKWNFTKFLINKKGQVVARFEPTAAIAEIEKQIEELLK